MQGSFIWDDDAHVTRPELRSANGLYRIWFELGATQQYYPLLHSAFWLQHKLWGDHVVGYHLTNVLLHAAAACLAYLVLRKLHVPGAWLAAAIFALHPMHVESVAWITEQKNTLSAVFYLGAMLAYLRFDEERQMRHYLGALTLFILGLLCKTVIATLPAALLVIFWWQRGRLSWRQDVQPLLPFFARGALAGLFTAWVERTLIGASGVEHDLSPVQRGLLAGRVVWFYLAKLLWPANLAFMYPRWNIDPGVGWQWLFPLAALMATGAFFLLRARWRAPLAAWLLFVGTLFPVLGFLNVYPFRYSFVANHFQYLASLAAIAIAAAVLTLAVGRLSPSWRWAGYASLAALLGTLAAATWREAHVYRDVVVLYETTIARNPACWFAYNNVGVEYAKRGQLERARDNVQQALRLNPDYPEAQYNFANYCVAVGDAARAIEHYRRALELRPNYPFALNNLGLTLCRQGETAAAIEHLKLATQYNPEFADAFANLGYALQVAGQNREAIEQLRRSLELNPERAETHKLMGDALVRADDVPAAIDHYRQALRLRSDYIDAEHSLGIALAKSGREAEAIPHFEAATHLGGGQPAETLTAFANLVRAYARTGRAQDAIATAERAIEFAHSHQKPEVAAQLQAWLVELHAGRGGPDAPADSNARLPPAPLE